MQLRYSIPFYKEAPFFRMLIALAAGILLQWYLPLSLYIIGTIVLVLIGAFVSSAILLRKQLIVQAYTKSVLLQSILVVVGMVLVYSNYAFNSPQYFTKKITGSSYSTIVSLSEPLSEKTKTYKAIATIQSIVNNDTITPANGKLLIYFKKDSTALPLQYGSTILLTKPLIAIQNNGNPGAFDYAQQSLMHGITHQVFVNANDYIVLPEKHTTALTSFLYTTRNKVLTIIDKYIPSIKEKGLAEALLIGYRDDLDKDLNQAYSNTGTVHVIAISGLHLGFIYLVLVYFFKPFEKKRYGKKVIKWIKPITIITILWLFSLLAGGAPSILRSAIMFTCIVVGDSLQRKASIYNTLSVSAFIILCIYPFSLWDVGFQLSYAAVLSIVLFMQPMYRLWYIKNKVGNWLWKLSAVTLSAQLLTIPITIYHFHQFPNLFLITNIVAVPLSTIILAGELILLAVSFWPAAAVLVGKVITWLIWAMNSYIEWWNNFSFALTDFLQINMWQCLLLYSIIGSLGYWLLQKSKRSFYIALASTLAYVSTLALYKWQTTTQQKLIVYNIPKQQAIDIVKGGSYQFIGDSLLLKDGATKNFHLKPTRIFYQTKPIDSIGLLQNGPLYSYQNRQLLLIDDAYRFTNTTTLKEIDVAILSHNPKLYIDSLHTQFELKQVVADGTNPLWKVKLWQKDCERLKIPFHYTVENGAFIKNLN